MRGGYTGTVTRVIVPGQPPRFSQNIGALRAAEFWLNLPLLSPQSGPFGALKFVQKEANRGKNDHFWEL